MVISVKLDVYQGSIPSPLLFVMVLESLSREFRGGLPWERLYADDLVIITERLEELEERYLAWENNMEHQCLKVDIEKTKVMKSGTNEALVFALSKYPCSICRKRVGVNSVYCSFCRY